MFNSKMNPAEQGRTLEDIIYSAVQHIPEVEKNLRENDIRQHFNDASLNGVDHWIQIQKTHFLIQDKWKESNTQQEVSQFLTCAERIQNRIEETDTVYLLWVSKKEPTANSMKLLHEKGAILICCSINIESLAKLAILQICECLTLDSTKALQSIVSTNKPSPMERKAKYTVAQTLSYDDTEEGKKEIDEMKKIIEQIQNNILRKVEMSINMDAIPDTYNLWRGLKPTNPEDWYNGKVSKFDYDAFLKSIKGICWPTKQKKLQSRYLFFYTKLRKISVDFAVLASQYESKRKTLLTKKSSWAKLLTSLKVKAEPMSEAEFKGALENCEDYWINTWENGPGSERKRIPNSGILYAFHSAQCTVY